MKKTAHFLMERAFTLVELLIVIALIGVLAVAVLAAINPLEQLNRARDTGMESDASQLLAAIDRYYATQEKFPWQTVDVGSYPSPDTALAILSAQDPIIGVCGNVACTTDGVLLGQYELKSEFRNRKFITTTADISRLWLGKDIGASSSVYACWVPTSKAKRTQATHDTGSIPNAAATCDPADAGTTWQDLGSSCFICIPR